MKNKANAGKINKSIHGPVIITLARLPFAFASWKAYPTHILAAKPKKPFPFLPLFHFASLSD